MPKAITTDGETRRLLLIAARLGKRLGYQLRGLEFPSLPGEDWRECFTLYARAVRAAVDGQSPKEAGPLTDEQYTTEVAELARETVLGLSDLELEKLLKERKARDRARLPTKTGPK